MGDRTGRRPQGGLESEVLAALWAAQDPRTAGQVQEALGSGLAYTSVLTILNRLHAKGLLERTPHGRAYGYRPVLAEAQFNAEKMRRALESGSDRSAVLARFVESLDVSDEHVLRALLADAERPEPG
jgi:predicted transcriptional regulator